MGPWGSGAGGSARVEPTERCRWPGRPAPSPSMGTGRAVLERDVVRDMNAVSHWIRRLERHLGCTLFDRSGPGMAPTPAGVALGDGLGELLAAIATREERCRRAASSSRLRVGVGAALADRWLARRLPRFTRLHPSPGHRRRPWSSPP